MCNEDLAQRAKSGDQDALLTLWAQVRRLALKKARRWAVYHSGGVEIEDLEQAAFIALMGAVAGFDPEAGFCFNTWYGTFLLKEFNIATCRRSQRQIRDPLNRAFSLDSTPPGSPEGPTLAEIIPDERAEDTLREVERRMDLQILKSILTEAVCALPRAQRDAAMSYYFGKAPSNRVCRSNALHKLRRSPALMQRLDAFR